MKLICFSNLVRFAFLIGTFNFTRSSKQGKIGSIRVLMNIKRPQLHFKLLSNKDINFFKCDQCGPIPLSIQLKLFIMNVFNVMANFMVLEIVVCFGRVEIFCMRLCWLVSERGLEQRFYYSYFLNGKEDRRWKHWIL